MSEAPQSQMVRQPPSPVACLKSHLAHLRKEMGIRPSPFHALPDNLPLTAVRSSATPGDSPEQFRRFTHMLTFLLPNGVVDKVLHCLPLLTLHCSSSSSRCFYTCESGGGDGGGGNGDPYILLPGYCSCVSFQRGFDKAAQIQRSGNQSRGASTLSSTKTSTSPSINMCKHMWAAELVDVFEALDGKKYCSTEVHDIGVEDVLAKLLLKRG